SVILEPINTNNQIYHLMKNKFWELFILFLSLYVIVELGIEIIHPFSQQTIDLINQIDLVICVIFLGDFFYFFFKAGKEKKEKAEKKKERLHYLRTHWIDFIASIPFMTFLRAFRLVRVVRVVRLLRGVKGLVNIFRMLGTSRLQNILISYLIIMLLVMGYCSLAFYSFEKGVNPNVNNYFDAFWWAFVSLTSIGYGDVIPTTTEGRIVGMVLALAGMGLFSVITAQLATVFFKISKKEEKEESKESKI
ncbi:MAG TPA: ion transporter, partial [Prolixibacteraceae bacterium]|nr:ion transporter [Prolixibacteraceae bacterium]